MRFIVLRAVITFEFVFFNILSVQQTWSIGILTEIRKRKSWNGVEKVAKQVANKRANSNEKIKERQQTLPYVEGHEAIREYNSYTD